MDEENIQANSQFDRAKLERIGRDCLCANLRKASRAVTNLYDEFLQPSGLLATQFILLGSIGARSAIALTPLAEELGLDPTTLARNLKPLERDGLIQIATGTDRRTRILKLTEAGMEVWARACPLWEEAQAWMIGQIGEARWRVMLGDWSEVASLARK